MVALCVYALRPSPQELANARDAGNGNRCLHIAAQNGHFDLCKVLIRKGADVNAQNAGGQTALHMATTYEFEEVITLLLSKGADGAIKNEEGFEARFGLGGEKDPLSVAGMMKMFENAATEAELLTVLDKLAAASGDLDRATFASTGLRLKKAKKETWTPDVQAKFVAVMQAMG